jgi:glucan biosynthesis protein C
MSKAPQADRLLFIDNIRWFAISLVVVMHAAVTYSPFGSWYFRDLSGTSRTLAIGLGTYQSFQHAVSMGLLFGIAGYFARASLLRKGGADFLRDRAYRLGLPLLLYVFIIGPVTEYYVAGSWNSNPRRPFGTDWLYHIATGDFLSGSGPLWFCLVLLVFCAVLAAWHAVLPLRPTCTPAQSGPTLPRTLAFIAAMALLSFLMGVLVPRDRTVLNVDLHDLPQYPLMFLAGLQAHRQDWPRHFPTQTGRMWGILGLLLASVAWVAIIGLGGALHSNLSAYGGGWHWQAAAMASWRAFACVAFSLGLITLFRARLSGQGAVTLFLSRNAFGVYVFHPPILIMITLVLHTWPWAAAAKFFIASAFAIPATFLFVGLVARRTPGLRAIV